MVALLCFQSVAWLLFGKRAAILSTIAFACHPFVLRAIGWSYVDGFGITYFLVALLGVTCAARGECRNPRAALFVAGAAKVEERGLLIRTAFTGREAGRLMTYPAVSIPAATTVREALRDYFAVRGYRAFPVLDGERLLGLLDADTARRVPAVERDALTAGELVSYQPELVVDEHQDVAELLERPAFERLGRALVLTSAGGIGIVSITDVQRVLRALELGGLGHRDSPAPRSRAHDGWQRTRSRSGFRQAKHPDGRHLR